MSRELIASNIVNELKSIIANGRPKLVTREPFEFEDLSNAQYPAVLVQTDSETRLDSSIDGDTSNRAGEIIYSLVCFVKSTQIDTARNQLADIIEEKLEEDRSRGGYAIDTQVISIETDQGSIRPIGGVIITVSVKYQYTRK